MGFEAATYGFQIRCSNHLTMLPPYICLHLAALPILPYEWLVITFFCGVSSNCCELTLFLVCNIFFFTIVMIIIMNINMNCWNCSWVSRGTCGGHFRWAHRFLGKTATERNNHDLSYEWSNKINYHWLSWRIWTIWPVAHGSIAHKAKPNGHWPVALEGEGSNCFSITQLVGQKRQ